MCTQKISHLFCHSSHLSPIFGANLSLFYGFFFACYALPKLFAPTNQSFHVNVDFSASSDREGEGARSEEGINGAKQ